MKQLKKPTQTKGGSCVISCVITQRREAQNKRRRLLPVCAAACSAPDWATLCTVGERKCVMLTPKQRDHRRGGGGDCGRGPFSDWWI